MITNTKKVFRRIKALLQALAQRHEMPIHYNSLMILINWMPEFVGPKVNFELNDLESDRTMKIIEKLIRKWIWRFPPEEKITKAYAAAFINGLDSSLVDKTKSPPDFAEDVFSRYLDPTDEL